MSSKYSLANHPEAYRRAIWLIRDYARIKKAVSDIDGYPSGGNNDGTPRSTEPHSGVETAAIRRAELSAQLDIVDFAIEQIPEEYRAGIWANVTKGRRFPDTANINTWKKWKQRFIWFTAWRAGFLI